MDQLHHALADYGLTPLQIKAFLSIYQYGPKPASTIAKMIWVERTNTYKTIQVLISHGLVAEASKEWTKHFFVADKQVFRNLLSQRKKTLEQTEQQLPIIETELAKLDTNRISPLPKMRFFEWPTGIEHLFDDIIHTITANKLLVIKCFASNTIESQSQSPHQLITSAPRFIDFLNTHNIHIETHLGNGVLTLEHVLKTFDKKTIGELPAGNAAVHLFIVWHTLYITIFKSVPLGIKIESPELADIMHFLLKQVG
jgi:DNA-binding MarR family transcriptional regulator